jgi:hypothetical protein
MENLIKDLRDEIENLGKTPKVLNDAKDIFCRVFNMPKNVFDSANFLKYNFHLNHKYKQNNNSRTIEYIFARFSILFEYELNYQQRLSIHIIPNGMMHLNLSFSIYSPMSPYVGTTSTIPKLPILEQDQEFIAILWNGISKYNFENFCFEGMADANLYLELEHCILDINNYTCSGFKVMFDNSKIYWKIKPFKEPEVP